MMHAMIRAGLIILLAISTGCASAPDYKAPTGISEDKLAKLTVYRSRGFLGYHKFNPEKPFFYIDDQYIGKLGTTEFVEILVTPGKHVISVKDSFLFMPLFESEKIEIECNANEKYYIRYSKDPAGYTKTGNNGVAFESMSMLLPVTKYEFADRF